MTIWIKENGSQIEINDEKATVEKAKSLGWKKKSGRKPKKVVE